MSVNIVIGDKKRYAYATAKVIRLGELPIFHLRSVRPSSEQLTGLSVSKERYLTKDLLYTGDTGWDVIKLDGSETEEIPLLGIPRMTVQLCDTPPSYLTLKSVKQVIKEISGIALADIVLSIVKDNKFCGLESFWILLREKIGHDTFYILNDDMSILTESEYEKLAYKLGVSTCGLPDEGGFFTPTSDIDIEADIYDENGRMSFECQIVPISCNGLQNVLDLMQEAVSELPADVETIEIVKEAQISMQFENLYITDVIAIIKSIVADKYTMDTVKRLYNHMLIYNKYPELYKTPWVTDVTLGIEAKANKYIDTYYNPDDGSWDDRYREVKVPTVDKSARITSRTGKSASAIQKELSGKVISMLNRLFPSVGLEDDLTESSSATAICRHVGIDVGARVYNIWPEDFIWKKPFEPRRDEEGVFFRDDSYDRELYGSKVDAIRKFLMGDEPDFLASPLYFSFPKNRDYIELENVTQGMATMRCANMTVFLDRTTRHGADTIYINTKHLECYMVKPSYKDPIARDKHLIYLATKYKFDHKEKLSVRRLTDDHTDVDVLTANTIVGIDHSQWFDETVVAYISTDTVVKEKHAICHANYLSNPVLLSKYQAIKAVDDVSKLSPINKGFQRTMELDVRYNNRLNLSYDSMDIVRNVHTETLKTFSLKGDHENTNSIHVRELLTTLGFPAVKFSDINITSGTANDDKRNIYKLQCIDLTVDIQQKGAFKIPDIMSTIVLYILGSLIKELKMIRKVSKIMKDIDRVTDIIAHVDKITGAVGVLSGDFIKPIADALHIDISLGNNALAAIVILKDPHIQKDRLYEIGDIDDISYAIGSLIIGSCKAISGIDINNIWARYIVTKIGRRITKSMIEDTLIYKAHIEMS